MRMSGVAAGVLCVAAVGAASGAQAQEEPPPPPIKPIQEEPPPPPIAPPGREPARAAPVTIDPASPDFSGFAMGDDTEQLVVGDERVFAAAGGITQPVWIRLPEIEVRCENAVLWGNRDRLLDAVTKRREKILGKDPEQILGPVVHALYAEGSVFLRRGSQVIRAERLFVDFEHGKAYFIDATMRSPAKSGGRREVPLTVRAAVIRAESRNRYVAEDATVTTCNYADPHFLLETGSIEVDYSKDDASFSTSWWPTVRMDTLVADRTPILAFPKLAGDKGLLSTPLQGFNFSHSSRYGNAVEVTWGKDIRREDGSKWGDWRLHTDHRSARGPGLGLDVSHEALPTKDGGPRDLFEFSGYLQRDSRGFDTFSERGYDGGLDRQPDSRNRGFAHLFDRWFVEDPSITGTVGDGWRVDTEVSWLSDRGYLPEFHAGDADSRKQQETFVQARNIWGNQGLSLLGSYRLNDAAASLTRLPLDPLRTDYENQTQYLPSATYHLINQPVVSAGATGLFPVNVSAQASVANVRRRYDDHYANGLTDLTGWQGETVRRGDLETRVTTPFSIGDVHIDPATGASLYGVDDANGFVRQRDGRNGRWSAFWDLRAGTQAWRTYPDASCDFLDVQGLRHVVSLDAQVFDRFEVSDGPFTFQENDLVDDLAEDRIGSVRLRNRLQTKRDGDVIDWLDVESRFLHYFDASPRLAGSPFGLREDFPSPLQRLDFPGQEKYDAYARDGAAFWQQRARVQLTRTVWLSGEADYDFERNAMETSEAGVRWFAVERASFYVGRRTIHGDSTILTTRMDYRLSDRWGVELEHQEDTKSHRGLRTQLSLFRRAHDYTIAVELEADTQSNQRRVSFAIYPNLLSGGHQDPFGLRRPLDYAAMKWYR